jgi:hypothetical protein
MCCVLGLLPLALAIAQEVPDKKPEPTGFAPIAFFNKKCTYCHAKDGIGYPDDLSKRYDEERLFDRLVEMTDEKAHAPLTNKELEVLASWFRSLMKKEPYIAWVTSKEGVLSLEASAMAKLTSTEGTLSLAKGTWELRGAPRPDQVVIRATLDGRKSELNLSKASVSHPAPKGK